MPFQNVQMLFCNTYMIYKYLNKSMLWVHAEKYLLINVRNQNI